MTSPPFQLSVLGPWQLTADGSPLQLRSREQRVLAALALRPFPTRCRVAATLWPEGTRKQALGSLRAAVFNLRREAPGVVVGEGDTLALTPGVSCDIEKLRHHIAQAHAPAYADLEETISSLDVHDLLTGWYGDWVEDERESLRIARMEALTAIAKHCLGSQPDVAQAAAAAAGVLDPLAEEPCELLMRSHFARGERIDAIREFERFRQSLLEIGLQPSPSLRSLAYQVRTARGTARSGPAPQGTGPRLHGLIRSR